MKIEEIKIEINGEPHIVNEDACVADILKDWKLVAERVAVELNRSILPRVQFDTKLQAGDRLEIVTFVGGG